MGTNIKSRVEQFCRYRGISVRNFCIRIGTSNGYFKETLKSISDEYRSNIGKEFPELSISWLVLGEGTMLNEFSTVNEVIPKYYTSHTPVRVATTTARAGYSDSYYADEYLKDMPIIMIESDAEYSRTSVRGLKRKFHKQSYRSDNFLSLIQKRYPANGKVVLAGSNIPAFYCQKEWRAVRKPSTLKNI